MGRADSKVSLDCDTDSHEDADADTDVGETVAEAKEWLHDAPEEGTGQVEDGEGEAAEDDH